MQRSLATGKIVTVVFLTDGDLGTNPEQRKNEISASMNAIGVKPSNTFRLSIPEAEVLSRFLEIAQAIGEIAKKQPPDCVIGMDYEGGHEGHDSASFFASETARLLACPFYVFPAYHLEKDKRKNGTFLTGRRATDTILLTDKEVELKITALEAHKGQIDHFFQLQRQSPDYFKRLFTREIFRLVSRPYDYLQPPAPQVRYEKHQNGHAFKDFYHAVHAYYRAAPVPAVPQDHKVL